MTIINGQVANADEVMNAMGKIFLNYSQSLFNEAYIGFDSKLYNSGAPNLKNVLYSVFAADDADVNYGFVYDSTDDIYKLTDLSGVLNYAIIEATSYNGDWVNGTNDVEVISIDSGSWLVYATTGTSEVQKAKVHKSLWWGDSTTTVQTKTPLISDFTSVTAVKVSDSGDIGKQVHTVVAQVSGGLPEKSFSSVGTFVNTTTNTNVNSWSHMFTLPGAADEDWDMPNGTTLNTSTNEFETDTSADDISNPATCSTHGFKSGGVTDTDGGIIIILCKGDITWVDTGNGDVITHVDYVTDDSIPLFTAADTLANEGVGNGTLIFKDTVASTDNAIASINSTIDATSSEQISISADGGSNYTDVNNGEIARPTAGTALWRRIVITRTDLSKTDNVTEQAVKYNFY